MGPAADPRGRLEPLEGRHDCGVLIAGRLTRRRATSGSASSASSASAACSGSWSGAARPVVAVVGDDGDPQLGGPGPGGLAAAAEGAGAGGGRRWWHGLHVMFVVKNKM